MIVPQSSAMDPGQQRDTPEAIPTIDETADNTTDSPEQISPPPSNPRLPSPNSKDSIYSLEDSLISGLESICGLFDNIYLLKSLGIINEDNFLYRRLNKGEWGSKLWFITLLLSARKSFSRLLKIINAKSKLKKEVEELSVADDQDLVKDVLMNKFMDALKKCSALMKDVFFELLQTLAYLVIVVVEVFKVNVSKKLMKFLEPLSHFIAVIRIFTTGYATVGI